MHLQAPRRRTLLRRLAWLVPVGALLALPLTALPGSPETAQAAASDRSFGSWNMHGQRHHGEPGTGPPESRWSNALPRAMRHVDVLALQEAGSAPPDESDWSDDPRYRGTGVTEHIYNMGNSYRPDVRNIYWADSGQQRNGLAIVTRETAEEVVQLPVHRGNARPLMGIRLGNDWYFTAHALSNGPGRSNDDADIIETVRQFMARPAQQGRDWLMLADFNHGPGNLPLNLQRYVFAANAPTHQGGSELDFGVGRQQNNGSLSLGRHGLANSDHSILRIEHRYCRRSKETDCNAPLPGHTYRYFSQHEENKVIARGNPSLYSYWKSQDAKDPNFQLEVRYSDAPNRYLLSFGKECIERRADDFHTTTKACDPADKNQHWELTSNRIHAPNLGPELQPSPTSDLTLDTSAYYWKPEEIERPSTESDPDRELRKRKRDHGAGQDTDPGDGADAGAGGEGAGQGSGKTFPSREKCDARGMELTDYEGPFMCTKKGDRWVLEIG